MFTGMAIALCANSATAGSDQRVTSDVGGFFVIGAAYDDNISSVGILRDGEIYLNMQIATDHGWTISGRVELEATSSTDQIDEAYVTIEGDFGRFRIGQEDGAKSRITNSVIYAPGGRVGYYDSGNATGVVDAGAGATAGGDAIGVFYDSSSFHGFRFGISWQPDTTVDGQTDSNEPVFIANNRVSAGIAYDTVLSNELGLGFNAGLFDQDDQAVVWAVGGYSSYWGLRAALHYEVDGTDEIAFGASYKWDEWTIGGGIAHEKRAPDNNLLIAGWLGATLAPGLLATMGIERHDDETGARAIAGIGYLQFSF